MIALMIQGIWKSWILEYQWRWDFGRNGAKFPLWRSWPARDLIEAKA